MDQRIYLEWLEKAVNQNNPLAMHAMGNWVREKGDDQEKAVSYYRAGAELGWKNSMVWLAKLLKNGGKDLGQAAVWSAKGGSKLFLELLEEIRGALENAADGDFDRVCYALGWGVYWYVYGGRYWVKCSDKQAALAGRCLDYYCSCVEQQQEAIFTFLLCWNQMTGGVKGPGQMIAQMVWEQREDNLVKAFEWRKGGSWGCVMC
jgi:hypothetical protein